MGYTKVVDCCHQCKGKGFNCPTCEHKKLEILQISYRDTYRDANGLMRMHPQHYFCGDCRFFEGSALIIFGIDDPPHGICDHESNWRPSRGELHVWADCNCRHYEPKDGKKDEVE